MPYYYYYYDYYDDDDYHCHYHYHYHYYYYGGVVVLSVEYQTCDQEVVGSSLGRARGVETLGKFLTPMCVAGTNLYCLVNRHSPSSTSWYRPKGGDALRLGSKGRCGLCVGGT